MRNTVMNHKYIVAIFTVVLLVFGVQSVSSGQTLRASSAQPLTETTLNASKVTLTLSGGTYERWLKKEHANAFTVSGIAGVTLKSTFDSFDPFFDVQRVSNAAVRVELDFVGNMDTDATLTFTVGAGAIANYNGPALTADVSVTASHEEVEAPTTQNPDEQASGPATTTVEIQGPWLWMVVPTDPKAGGGISTEIDSLADASGGSITETRVAQNGVNEGDAIGHLHWISSEIHWSEHQCREYEVERRPTIIPGFLSLPDVCINPTVCWANNINNLIRVLGMGTGQNTKAHTAYALINLISPYEQADAVMMIRSGDAVKVWLNGNVVHREAAESLGCRKIDVPLACDPQVCISDPELEPGHEGSISGAVRDVAAAAADVLDGDFSSRVRRIPVTLKAGDNLLLVKVRQHGAYWDMRVHLDANFTMAIPTNTAVSIPVTGPPEIPTTATTVSLLPSPVASPAIGEQLTLSLNIAGGENVAGYQATVQFDTTVLRYVSSANANYLPTGAFFVPPRCGGESRETRGNFACWRKQWSGDPRYTHL